MSFHLVEHPIRSAGSLDRFKRSAIAIGLATSVALGALFMPTVLKRGTHTSVAMADTGSKTGRFRLLDWKAAEREVFPVKQYDCLGHALSRCTLVRGSGMRVLLMGDSHATMWAPGFIDIAKRENWTLVLATWPGCPWQQSLHWPGSIFAGCPEHHADWYGRIVPKFDPQLVILVDKDYDSPRFGWAITTPTGKNVHPGAPGYDAILTRASGETIDSLRKPGRRIVMFEPTPLSNPTDPLKCLSKGTTPSKCTYRALPGPSPLERYFREESRKFPDVYSLDLDRVLCPRLPICDPIVDNVIVLHDGQGHITDTFARSQSATIQAKLQHLGISG